MHTPRFIVAGLILLGAPIFTSCDSGRPPDSPPVPCTSLSGEVDTAFATNGWFIHDGATGGNGSDLSHALVEDAQGRIIIAGESTGAAPGSEMVLWRLLPDGSPDASFGGVGWITHQGAAGGSAGDVAYGVVVDGQGRIVATGASSGAGGNALDMAVWRYLEDGTLDPGFGVGGVFTHHDGAGGGDQDIGRDLIVDANDRIVVTGSSLNATFGVSMMVWRLTGDGVLDSKLGGGGFVAYLGDDPSPGSASGNALAQDPSGMILVAGTSTVFGPAMTIWRLRDDGGLDPEWGGTGIVAHCIPGWNGGGPQGGEGEDIAIDGQGRVVVAGRTLENSSDMAVWRYRSNGSLDTSFNKQGWITHGDFNTRVNTERAFSVAIDPCGDLLVGGLVWSFEASFAVWRVVDDGRVDPSFGVGGVALMRDPNAAWNQSTTGVQGIVIGPSGQVFVNGYTQPDRAADPDTAVVCIR